VLSAESLSEPFSESLSFLPTLVLAALELAMAIFDMTLSAVHSRQIGDYTMGTVFTV
jgi:hypothetical protein